MKKSNFLKNNGYVLLMSLLITASLMFFGLLYLNFFRAERTLAQHAEHNIIIDSAADAGIDTAISSIRQNYKWKGNAFPQSDTITLTASNALFDMVFYDSLSSPQIPDGPYSTNNSESDTAVTGYGGQIVPPYSAHVISTGKYNGIQHKKEAIIATSISPYKYGIFGEDSISLSGTVYVDSFDSTKGPYNSLTNAGSNANISTNSIAAGAVSLAGTVDVNGSIYIGPGGEPSTVVSHTMNVTYDGINTLQNTETFPVLVPPATTNQGALVLGGIASQTLSPPVDPLTGKNIATYSTLDLTGNAELTLQSGIYVFTEDIKIAATTKLIIPPTASVEIYAMKNVDIGGGSLINTSQNASNFSIYGGAGTTSVKIGGGAGTYLFLYAPKSTVTISGNEGIYGSIIGKNIINTGNPQIHYDEGLKQNRIFKHNGIAIVQSRW